MIGQMHHTIRAWRPREIAPAAILHIAPWISDCPCSHVDPCLIRPCWHAHLHVQIHVQMNLQAHLQERPHSHLHVHPSPSPCTSFTRVAACVLTDCHSHCCLKPFEFLLILSHLSLLMILSPTTRWGEWLEGESGSKLLAQRGAWRAAHLFEMSHVPSCEKKVLQYLLDRFWREPLKLA